MKFHCLLFLLTVSFTPMCMGESTNSFGIYLVTVPVDSRVLINGTGDWSQVSLAKTPVISDKDILSYDFTNHVMTLKTKAVERIPHPDTSGIPFVVVVNGVPVYLGVFMTSLSSIARTTPAIIVDATWRTNLPPNALQIDRAYPEQYSETGSDPRSDERIKRALTALHKLK